MMADNHPATIYLSSQRGCTQSDWFRSYRTFNFGNYQNEYRKSFMQLSAFNDETLKSQHTIGYIADHDSSIFLLPVVGGIHYRVGEGQELFLDVGESVLLPVQKGEYLKITNPYNNELVNYIHAWFTTEKGSVDAIQTTMDIDRSHNGMITLFETPAIAGYLGKFSGRIDYSFTPKNPGASIFAFVIEGAFEFQNRLLEHRDGFSISGCRNIEFEALSNDAIILVLEV
jgi:quercetin 2,3-dioxygenase